jgi:hypothetical protein
LSSIQGHANPPFHTSVSHNPFLAPLHPQQQPHSTQPRNITPAISHSVSTVKNTNNSDSNAETSYPSLTIAPMLPIKIKPHKKPPSNAGIVPKRAFSRERVVKKENSVSAKKLYPQSSKKLIVDVEKQKKMVTSVKYPSLAAVRALVSQKTGDSASNITNRKQK